MKVWIFFFWLNKQTHFQAKSQSQLNPIGELWNGNYISKEVMHTGKQSKIPTPRIGHWLCQGYDLTEPSNSV